MGADKLAENTPNAPNVSTQAQKFWDFNEKKFHLASVVRA